MQSALSLSYANVGFGLRLPLGSSIDATGEHMIHVVLVLAGEDERSPVTLELKGSPMQHTGGHDAAANNDRDGHTTDVNGGDSHVNTGGASSNGDYESGVVEWTDFPDRRRSSSESQACVFAEVRGLGRVSMREKAVTNATCLCTTFRSRAPPWSR